MQVPSRTSLGKLIAWIVLVIAMDGKVHYFDGFQEITIDEFYERKADYEAQYRDTEEDASSDPSEPGGEGILQESEEVR